MRRQGNGVALTLVALAQILACFLQFSPITPYGVQCPTAAVQRVLDGDTATVRPPQPGDESFVQCVCAEKKVQRAMASLTVPEEVSFISPTMLDVSFSLLPAVQGIVADPPCDAESLAIPPPTLPPCPA